MSTDTDRSPFAPAPPEEGLTGYSREGRRRWIEPDVSPGRYHRIRTGLAWGGMAAFLALPHIPVNGHPAVFLDIAQRRFHLFGGTFQPTENLLLVALGLLVVLSLFLITALFGRLWCGFLCPQPVWLEFFYRPVESLIEGPAEDRRRRQGRPPTPAERARKVLKWAVFLAMSSVFAHTIVSYFVGASHLATLLSEGPVHYPALFGFTVIVTGFFMADFASLRENVCIMACPYGRLQTVLYDQDTRIVGYDTSRGEPRGRKVEGAQVGDCIDCRRCVGTCPTGIDIRRGLQMECIGCAQCVDACDRVMQKLRRPTGLVRFTSLRELAGGHTTWLRRRVLAYSGLWIGAFLALLWLLTHQVQAETDILRAGREPYRVLPSGDVANQLQLRVANHTDAPQSFSVRLLSPEGGTLAAGDLPVEVGPQGVETLNVAVTLPRTAFTRGRVEATFLVEGSAGYQEQEPFLLLGPYQGVP